MVIIKNMVLDFSPFSISLNLKTLINGRSFCGAVYICARFSCCYISSIVMLIWAFLCSYFLSLIFVLLTMFFNLIVKCVKALFSWNLFCKFFLQSLKSFLQSFVYISSSSKRYWNLCLFLARANLPCPILVQLIFIGCNNGHTFPHNYIPDFEGLEVSGVLNRSK